MEKQKLFQILYVVLIIGLLLFMIFMVFWLTSESAECVRDSISYFEEKNNAECYCLDYDNLGGFQEEKTSVFPG